MTIFRPLDFAGLTKEAFSFTNPSIFQADEMMRGLEHRFCDDELPREVLLASLRHSQVYLRHLSWQVPQALAVFADPRNWRLNSVFDRQVKGLRKPQIRVDANINGKDTLQITWSLVQTSELTGSEVGALERMRGTDFLEPDSTWNEHGVASNTLVRLRKQDYPASPEYGAGDLAAAIREEKGQRQAFSGFLSAVLSLFRASLDVQVGDWVEFDEKGRLEVACLSYRVRRLAEAQLSKAQALYDEAAARFQRVLNSLGIDEPTMKTALELRDNTGVSLPAAIHALTGKKIAGNSAKAGDRALEERDQSAADLEICRKAYAQAKKEHRG
jgi:hypothetical protein